MAIHYQSPVPGGPQLLEELGAAAHGAEAGGAAFAFASSDGIELLFANQRFRVFAAGAAFDLVVGLDAITDLRAIAALERAAATYPGLSIRLFVNPYRGTTFHPKASWFDHGAGGGVAITGSGNLTGAGLLRNWEVFSAERLNVAQTTAVRNTWNIWRQAHAGALRPLNDVEARERARLNGLAARRFRRAARLAPAAAEQILSAIVPPVADELSILATEVIRNRMTQINVHRADYHEFFGVPLNAPKRVTLYRVYPDGSFSKPDTRMSLATATGNYRFTLRYMAGVPYPAAERPIALFQRVDDGDFKYHTAMPGEPGHQAIRAYLNQNVAAGPRSKSARMTLGTLEQTWPECPLLS